MNSTEWRVEDEKTWEWNWVYREKRPTRQFGRKRNTGVRKIHGKKMENQQQKNE